MEFNSTCRAQTIEGNDFEIGDLIINYTGSQSVDLTNTLDVINLLILQNGVLNTNAGSLTLKSNTTNTAMVDEVLTGTVLGEVTVERYIPAKRAFRFMSSAVNTTTPINDHWQEGVNNTSLTMNVNPTPGYGTHITGSSTGSNGFDATGTGNPSIFRYDNLNQLWEDLSDTDATLLNAGDAYRLFVRGSRAIDLSSNASVADPTVLRATGSLVTGPFINSDLGSSAGAFNLIGNPYQASVDMNATLGASSNVGSNFYYVWDPQLGQRGSYVTVILPSGANTSGSEANQYLQPGQSAFVTTLNNGAASLQFNESQKATGENTMTFTTPSNSSSIIGRLFRTNNGVVESSLQDSFGMFFNSTANNLVDNHDATNIFNQDESIAIKYGTDLLSIDNRQLPGSHEVVQLSHYTYRTMNYQYQINVQAVLERKVYLDDNYLQTVTLLGDGLNTYDFSVDINNPSSDVDRFNLRFENQTLSINTLEMLTVIRLSPNPVRGDTAQINMVEGAVDVSYKATIYNLTGQQLLTTHLDFFNGRSHINGLSKLSTGTYLLEMKNGDDIYNFKFVKM